eukprot:Nitzschia sp. Nitz4//scaffold507_size4475//838//1310//NITZ4_009245-RA/size4475-exonerate_protein2genome-gene-0.0-mRNA-1//1//CDS//3329553617//3825//frame0
MNQHLLWDLGERALWHFISTFGSSRIAKPAYPVWPTSDRHSTAGYPEGNFGGNQLLDGSISLSPLYPNLTIDLSNTYRKLSLVVFYDNTFHWLGSRFVMALSRGYQQDNHGMFDDGC